MSIVCLGHYKKRRRKENKQSKFLLVLENSLTLRQPHRNLDLRLSKIKFD